MPARKPAENRLHDLDELEPGLGVQLRREADLGVDDAIAREVLDALGRHALERRPCAA